VPVAVPGQNLNEFSDGGGGEIVPTLLPTYLALNCLPHHLDFWRRRWLRYVMVQRGESPARRCSRAGR